MPVENNERQNAIEKTNDYPYHILIIKQNAKTWSTRSKEQRKIINHLDHLHRFDCPDQHAPQLFCSDIVVQPQNRLKHFETEPFNKPFNKPKSKMFTRSTNKIRIKWDKMPACLHLNNWGWTRKEFKCHWHWLTKDQNVVWKTKTESQQGLNQLVSPPQTLNSQQAGQHCGY